MSLYYFMTMLVVPISLELNEHEKQGFTVHHVIYFNSFETINIAM